MMFPNVIALTLLALSSGVSAIRTERTQKNSLRALVVPSEGGSRRRAKAGKHEDEDDDAASCKGSDVEESFYDAFFTMEDKTDDCYVTENCRDVDFLEIGFLIREIVSDLDDDFPKPSVSNITNIKDIDTKVCPQPGLWVDDQNTRRLFRRYIYRSGGTCRRCRSRRRDLHEEYYERELSSSSAEEISEMAEETCNLYHTTVLSTQVCDNAIESIEHTALSLEEMVKNFDKPDEAIKASKEVRKIAEDATNDLAKLHDLVDVVDKACQDATDYAEQGDEKNTKESLKEGEDAAKDVIKITEGIAKDQSTALRKKRGVAKKLMKQQWEKKEDANKAMYEAKKAELEIVLKELEARKEEVKEQLKTAKNMKDYEAIKEMELEVELMELETKATKEENEAQIKAAQAELAHETKMMEIYEMAMFEATYATDTEEWMKAYEDYLEAKIPAMLLDLYNTESTEEGGEGCLVSPVGKDIAKFKVNVELWVRESEDETFIDDCKNKPFDDWGEEDWPDDFEGGA